MDTSEAIVPRQLMTLAAVERVDARNARLDARIEALGEEGARALGHLAFDHLKRYPTRLSIAHALMLALALYPPESASPDDLEELTEALFENETERVCPIRNMGCDKPTRFDVELVVFDLLLLTVKTVRVRRSWFRDLLCHKDPDIRRRAILTLPRVLLTEG